MQPPPSDDVQTLDGSRDGAITWSAPQVTNMGEVGDSTRGRTSDLLTLIAVWLVAVAIVNPIGDFPLNDDWSFGWTIRQLVETGDFRPSGWTAMPLLTNTLWGGLFTMQGFSFTALRISTLTLGLLGICCAYLLIRDMRKPRWVALATALTLAFSPLYFALSHTVMTDVPFAVWLMVSAWLLARCLTTGSAAYLALGTLASMAAILSRQLGVAVPLGFGLIVLMTEGLSRKSLMKGLTPLVAAVTTLLLFQHWLSSTGRMPALYHSKNELIVSTLLQPALLIKSIVSTGPILLLYCGMFWVPLLPLLVTMFSAQHARTALLIALVSALGLAARIVYAGHPMPIADNIITAFGIGPLTLHDVFFEGPGALLPIPTSIWLVWSVASVVSGALLVSITTVALIDVSKRWLRRQALASNERIGVFLILCAMLYCMPLLISGFMDRYLVPLMPILSIGILGIAQQHSPWLTGSAKLIQRGVLVILACVMLFSVAVTRDYLTWNRARWHALHHLMKVDGVQPQDIDGGFEFNGYHLYDPKYQPSAGHSWWWVHKDDFLVSFSELPGFRVACRYPYQNWLPPQPRHILVLQRLESQHPATCP